MFIISDDDDGLHILVWIQFVSNDTTESNTLLNAVGLRKNPSPIVHENRAFNQRHRALHVDTKK